MLRRKTMRWKPRRRPYFKTPERTNRADFNTAGPPQVVPRVFSFRENILADWGKET